MASITTRSGKGSALTHAEVDANFTNLNSDKLERNDQVTMVFIVGTQTLTNQASTLGDFVSIGYSWHELTTTNRFNRVRLNSYVATASASANTPIIFMQYSTNSGSTWTTIGSGTGTEVISLSTTGAKATSWMTLPAGAIGTDVYFRLAMQGGDGVADPVVRGVCVAYERA